SKDSLGGVKRREKLAYGPSMDALESFLKRTRRLKTVQVHGLRLSRQSVTFLVQNNPQLAVFKYLPNQPAATPVINDVATAEISVANEDIHDGSNITEGTKLCHGMLIDMDELVTTCHSLSLIELAREPCASRDLLHSLGNNKVPSLTDLGISNVENVALGAGMTEIGCCNLKYLKLEYCSLIAHELWPAIALSCPSLSYLVLTAVDITEASHFEICSSCPLVTLSLGVTFTQSSTNCDGFDTGVSSISNLFLTFPTLARKCVKLTELHLPRKLDITSTNSLSNSTDSTLFWLLNTYETRDVGTGNTFGSWSINVEMLRRDFERFVSDQSHNSHVRLANDAVLRCDDMALKDVNEEEIFKAWKVWRAMRNFAA
ncbi:hypothetical protein SeLEV6574_g08503, partial [Synchytrium endobioticum]